MKKILIASSILLCSVIAPTASGSFDFGLEIDIDFGSFQISEFTTDLGGLSYTLDVAEDADPVTAFAVGFNGDKEIEYIADTNYKGWDAYAGTEAEWGDVSEALFGNLEWADFLHFDPETEDFIDHFAVYWTDSDIYAIGEDEQNSENFWVAAAPIYEKEVEDEVDDSADDTVAVQHRLETDSPFVVATVNGSLGGGVAQVPEPSSLALFGLSLLCLGLFRRNKIA